MGNNGDKEMRRYCTILVSLIFSFWTVSPTWAVGLGLDDKDAEEFGKNAERGPEQQPSIPMNTEDPTWNAWNLPREDLMEGRVPGPFNPQRYQFGMDWQGIQTFFKLPLALTPEDEGIQFDQSEG